MPGLDMQMAGGLPIAGITALNNLRALGIGSETKLRLWGASGGVGHVALQLAKRMRAQVFAIASGADNVALAQQVEEGHAGSDLSLIALVSYHRWLGLIYKVATLLWVVVLRQPSIFARLNRVDANYRQVLREK